ncbi:hypothetical protein [Brucella intermedia]|uniref:hypothetical protein n=1 Tax=Brucella intermedia TaxID=94625 RepID=UPI00224B7DF3|nr:hypothetical protein [Brucella intermedia]
MTLNEIFADDRRNPPSDRSLPWKERRSSIAVVVEPKSHWASDMRAFRLMDRAYCYHADWVENGRDARFFDHPETCGDVMMMKARVMIAREIADGFWAT